MAKKEEKVDKALYNILYNKMLESGWTTIRSFTTGSRVPCSIETTRRAMNECEYKGIAPHTLAIIAKYLGFTPTEVRPLLKTYTADRDLWTLIGDGEDELTQEEKVVVDLFREIKSKGKDALNLLADQLKLVCNAHGITAADQLSKIRRQ